MDRLVRQPHMGRRPVGVAKNGDRLQPEVTTGANDAHGDLATIRDQHRIEGENLTRPLRG